ncbi:MAG TPA: hypothetical protein VK139_02925 [Microbacteriaceae bacterium]|nr:hypothetical protein [Microbacteriaceae bacterium]
MGLLKVTVASIVIAGGALGLTGCSGWTPFSSGTGSATATASDLPAPATSEPTPSESALDAPTPLVMGCDSILSLQDAYDLNPNLAADPSFDIPAQLGPIIDAGGVACAWVNLTSNQSLAIGVARPGEAWVERAANEAAATLTAVPTYGTGSLEGYFGVVDGVGIAETIHNGTIVRVVSQTFVEPGDAAQVMELVLSNVG